MGGLKILVVDEDEQNCELVKQLLQREGYLVSVAYNPAETATYDLPSFALIILEVAMTKVNGFDFAKRLKNNMHTEFIPIIFCSAIADEEECVMGLNIGADDYIVKPFRHNEFVARVRSVLRRSKMTRKRNIDISEGVYIPDIVFHELRIDVNNKFCYLHGRPINLTKTEYSILYLMFSNRNRIFTRQEIILHIWGQSEAITSRAVDTCLVRLRKKLDDYSRYIYTHKSYGYGMVDDAHVPA